MFLERGGGQNLVSTHNKRMNLNLKCFLVWKYVALCYGFSANSRSWGALSHLAMRQCFGHTGNQKADTFGMLERQDVCLPSCRGFFVVAVTVVYIFVEQVQISQNIDVIDFID
jgi:hypothetical protein